MSEETGMYGFETDNVKVNNLKFGLNQNVFLTKFEYITNGGKDGAEAEALDIVFNIDGTEKGYRKFPITKAFLKNNAGETTDPNTQEFKDAIKEFNAIVFHIAHCFVSEDTYKTKLARPISSFKEFCNIVTDMLPADFAKKPLDIFLQYQYSVSGTNDKTYLEIPKKMQFGKFVCPSIKGNFKEVREESPKDSDGKALYYVTPEGIEHLFVRNGYFVNRPYANQILPAKTSGSNDAPVDSYAVGQPSAQQAAVEMNTAQAGTTEAAW